MEPTQLGLVIAGSVIVLTIAAVVGNQQLKSKRERVFEKIEDPYSIRRPDGSGYDVMDQQEGVWHFYPNKGGRKSRRKKI